MMDVGDWVSVQRRLFDEESEFYGDGLLLALWITLIGRANWRDGTKRLAGQRKIVKRGQLVTSYEKLAAALGISTKAVRTRIAYLEKGHAISCEKGTHGTLITILNYDQYQTRPRERGTPNEPEGARHGHAEGTPGATSRTREPGNKETNNPPNPPAGDRDRRVRLMAGRIVSAVSADAFASLIDEDRRTLLRHYRTSERAQAAVQRLLRAKNVDSPEAWARSQLVEILMHVIDRPERDVHEPAASDPSRVPYMTSAGDRCCSGCVGATRALLKPDGSGAWDVWCTSCGVSGEGADIDAAVKSFHERMEVRHVEASP